MSYGNKLISIRWPFFSELGKNYGISSDYNVISFWYLLPEKNGLLSYQVIQLWFRNLIW